MNYRAQINVVACAKGLINVLKRPFLRACGPFLGGGSDSESDFESDWDSEPDRAGRGFSSSESLSTTFFTELDPESESELDEAFCSTAEKEWARGGNDRRIKEQHQKHQNICHTIIPPFSFLCLLLSFHHDQQPSSLG